MTPKTTRNQTYPNAETVYGAIWKIDAETRVFHSCGRDKVHRAVNAQKGRVSLCAAKRQKNHGEDGRVDTASKTRRSDTLETILSK